MYDLIPFIENRSASKHSTTLRHLYPLFLVMSFPAEGVEATIKNHIDDVKAFLDSRHAGCYAVYNCSQRSYRAAKFQNRVNTVCVLIGWSVQFRFLIQVVHIWK